MPQDSQDQVEADLRIAEIVAMEAIQAIRSAARRATIRASPILITSSIEDASRLIVALDEQIRRIHAALAKPTLVALGLEEPPQPSPPPISPESTLQ